MKNTKAIFILLLLLQICLAGSGQITAIQIQQFLAVEKKIKSAGIIYPSLVTKFYAANGYQLAWLKRDKSIQQIFFDDLDRAADLALNKRDYQHDFIKSYRDHEIVLINSEDSIAADLRITDAAIHFYGEVKIGNIAPVFRYDGLKYQPDFKMLPAILEQHIAQNKLSLLVNNLEPKSKEYNNAKVLLIHFNRVMAQENFHEVIINSSKTDNSNTSLIIKLYQLGVLDEVPGRIESRQLMQRLQAAQKLFNLLNDGTLRSTSKTALNVPLSGRKKELFFLLNYLRWINDIKTNDSLVLLNIPSTTLFTYINGSLVLDSRVIVGEPSMPTPTISSKITEIILYPYWNVPNKIATNELLPQIKRNIGFLEQNNFQVLNKRGKIMDPSTINWHALSSSYFPYLIRQSTGCDNSLGVVKLNFYNPFTVYMHDTPGKGLFALNKRYFSHGCMRVEKAIELAKLLASEHVYTIEKIAEQGCLLDQPPMVLPTDSPVAVMIIYSTAWYDKSGGIHFFDDPYQKLKR